MGQHIHEFRFFGRCARQNDDFGLRPISAILLWAYRVNRIGFNCSAAGTGQCAGRRIRLI